MKVYVVKVGGSFEAALGKAFREICRGDKICLQNLFSSGTLSLKVNTLGGPKLSTSLSLASSLAKLAISAGAGEVIIWDRSEWELKRAGYKIKRRGNIKVIATDSPRMGYWDRLFTYGEVGSLFSKIQVFSDASISLAVLKDHDIAGVTLSMKNYYGAIHNPNKYHDDGCDPFIPQVFLTRPVSSRHTLSIIDATKAQFHRGPSYHSKWFARPGLLILGRDPVAVDHFGWRLIEKLRARAGLPSLKEEGREPHWIFTAEKMGIGKTKYQVVEL